MKNKRIKTEIFFKEILKKFKLLKDENTFGHYLLDLFDEYNSFDLKKFGFFIKKRYEENGDHHESRDYRFIIQNLSDKKLYEFEIWDNGAIESSAISWADTVNEVKAKSKKITRYE